MTLLLRPEGADDHHAVRAVLVAAFGSAREADLVDRIRASPHYRPELSLVAQVDDRVVGQVMLDGTWLDSRVGRREVLMLTPLAVDPPWQGRGIGGALVRRALALADDAGEPLVVLEGAPGYYGHLGFEHAASHGIDLPLPSWAPTEAGQVRLLPHYRPGDATLRGRIVYPPAFDALDDATTAG